VAMRRRVGNLLALAVLSVLVQRPMHPYEMASVLRARGKDDDMEIKWGSFYTVVRNLEKHGLIEATESNRQGGRPERTIYRITDAGRDELLDWIRELVAVPEPEQPRFKTGLSVLAILPPDEVAALLERRLERITEQLSARTEALAQLRREIPRLFIIEDEYDLALREAEVAWVRGLLEELRVGAFPDLTAWREYHEQGRISPEMAQIAERGSTPD
jgi:DNA-binding PadR family transcriptional regulator